MALVRFGGFTLDTDTGELTRDGRPVKLHPQPAELLILLVQRQGSLVTREEIRKALWGGETHVDFDLGINSCVRQIRKALGDDADHPRFVETVPRKGYRFIAPVGTAELAPVDTAEPVAKSNPLRRRAGFLLVAIGLGAGLWLSSFRPGPDPSSLVRPRALTSFAGVERFAAISPDGEKVAYSWKAEGAEQPPENLYVQLVGESEPLQLTSENRQDYSPAWSPDGSQIAFLREILEPERPTMSEIRVISVLGGKERRLGTAAVRIENGPKFVSGLDWSPDGKYLAFSDKESWGEQEGIFLLSTETGEKRRLTAPPGGGASLRDREPAFSPDGKAMAFIRGAGLTNYQILLQNLEGGEARLLATESGVAFDVDWMPDGSALIYARHRWNEFGLTLVSVQDGRASDLSWGTGANSVSVSGDGGRLAYTRDQGWVANIWRAPGPASNVPGEPIELMHSTRTDFFPEYSPDGSHIAFSSWRSGSLAVWVCDSDGTRCLQVSEDNSTAPRWSPDGSRVGYIRTLDGKSDLYFTRLEGGFTRRLTREGIASRRPFAWSQDGKTIYYESKQNGTSQIWRRSLDGGEALPITRGGGQAPRESPDGRWLYYSKPRPEADYKWVDIWKVPVEGGEETPVLKGKLVEAPNFVLWRDLLIYRGWEGKPGSRQAVIDAYHLRTGHETRLLTFGPVEGSFGYGLSVSSEGKWILYSKSEPRNSDIIIVENLLGNE